MVRRKVHGDSVGLCEALADQWARGVCYDCVDDCPRDCPSRRRTPRLAKLLAGEPVRIGSWELPAEYRPRGDPHGQYDVEANGSLVRRG